MFYTTDRKLSLTASVFVETSTHTYSLSEEGFGYNCRRLNSSASLASREKYLAKIWKNSKMRSQLAATLRRWTDGRRCVGRVHSVVYNASAVTRGAGCLAKSRNGPKMVPCLLTSTDS